jgi:hypothetical protein
MVDTILIATLETSKTRGVYRLRPIISVVIDNRYLETGKLCVGSIAELFKIIRVEDANTKNHIYYYQRT